MSRLAGFLLPGYGFAAPHRMNLGLYFAFCVHIFEEDCADQLQNEKAGDTQRKYCVESWLISLHVTEPSYLRGNVS